MYLTISLILFIIISLIYNLYIILKYKTIPVSLSETSYILGGFKRYWFSAYCVLVSFLILPNLLTILPESIMFLGFLMSSGLLFAGMSPLFKEGMDKTIHYASAIVSFVTFILLLILLKPWLLLWYCICLVPFILWKKDCYVYFAEMLVHIFIILLLII